MNDFIFILLLWVSYQLILLHKCMQKLHVIAFMIFYRFDETRIV